MVVGKPKDKQEGARARYDLKDMLSGTYHLQLKFPIPPQIVPSTGDLAFNTQTCGGHFIYKPLQ
jgi:hypothetical protein